MMFEDDAPRPASGDQKRSNEIHDFLDGELDTDRKAEIRRRRDADPRLDERISRLESVDELLRAEFGGLADAPLAPRAPRVVSTRLAVLSSAAALLLTALVWIYASPQPHGPLQRGPLPIAELYTQHARDFVPDVICDTPEKLIEYTADAFGSAITARFDTDIVLVGWKSDVYSDGGGGDDDGSRVLLSTGPKGEPIVTLFLGGSSYAMVTKVEIDGATVSAFRERIAGITVVELTPLDEPRVLGLLRPVQQGT
ncbi:MAG: hypothetical protein AAFO89_12405 [Planctomycetota bacterium]